MLINNIRIAYRNLAKNAVFSYINIMGLSIGMAAFLFLVHYIRFERSYEDFHTKADNIFRITTDIYNGSEFVSSDCETYAPLGIILKDKMPEVVDYVRFYGAEGFIGVKTDKHNFLESGMYWVDPSVFDVFTNRAVAGELSKSLAGPFEVVLTQSLAAKYFGRTDVIDQSIEIDKHVYRIKAIVDDPAPNTHLKFSALLSRQSLKTLKPWYGDDKWNNNNDFTYILTTPGTTVEAFNAKLDGLWNSNLKSIDPDERFVAQPIKDIHLYSDKAYEAEPGGDAKTVYYFTIIAIFIMIIAWVNYINLSTARAVERAREVGIRKVMGSLKFQLILQFLWESFIVNIVAGFFALLFFQLLFPVFRELSGQPLPSNLFGDVFIWLLFSGLIIIGTLLSGIYPAFVLSSFQPAAVLKGKFLSSAHGSLLRKSLVVFQFGATVVMIIATFTVYLQIRFMREQDLGMTIENTIVLAGKQVNVPDSVVQQTSRSFKTELIKIPGVVSVSRAESLPGVDMQELSTTSMTRLGEVALNNRGGYEYCYFSIDADYISSMNMTLAAGRNFDADVANQDMVIVNEQAAQLLGFSDAQQAIGSKITFRTRRETDGSTIIGVLKNFHFRSPKEDHLPLVFYYGERASYYAVRVKQTNTENLIASLQSTWEKTYPNTVFNYFFLNDKYNQQYKSDTQFGAVMAAFSGLIIFIACLGLFGLASFMTIQRTKEIGIRKVLGASVTQIIGLLSVDFAKTVIIAAIIALPLAYFIMNEWLSGYFVRIELSAWIFIFAVLITLLVAMLVVGFQTFRTAVSNPVDSLKQE